MSEIETTPCIGGIYRDHAAPADFNLCRYVKGPYTGWQKSAGWTPVAAPIMPTLLVEGPVLVREVPEPQGFGAVVVEALTGHAWVRDATVGNWHSGFSVARWEDIEYPIVRHAGVSAERVQVQR